MLQAQLINALLYLHFESLEKHIHLKTAKNQTMEAILHKIGLGYLAGNFLTEKVDIAVAMLATDEDLTKLEVRNIGQRVKLKKTCRRRYYTTSAALSTIRSYVSNRSTQERALLFSYAKERNTPGSKRSKPAGART